MSYKGSKTQYKKDRKTFYKNRHNYKSKKFVKPRQIPISKAAYLKKNYWFPILILGIIFTVSVLEAVRQSPGGLPISLFTAACLAIIYFLGTRSYNNYVDNLNK